MVRKRVVFLGSRPLGKFALEYARNCPGVDVIGKVVLPNLEGCYWTEDPNQVSEVPVLTIDDLCQVEFDIGFSVNYWQIVPKDILGVASAGFFNVHQSYNLMYRGRYTNTFAILNARRLNIWRHGATLHRMTERLDDGEIVGSLQCDIREDDTALSLFERVGNLSKELIEKFFPRIVENNFVGTAPSKFSLLYKKKDLIDKEVDTSSASIDIYDKVRALDFPPFEPAYVMLGGERNYLTIREQDGRELFCAVDARRKVWIKKQPVG